MENATRQPTRHSQIGVLDVEVVIAIVIRVSILPWPANNYALSSATHILPKRDMLMA